MQTIIRPLASLCVAGTVLAGAAAGAQTVTRQGEMVSVHAEAVPIATLLSELARLFPIEKLMVVPEVQQRPVSIALDRVPLEAALLAILRASGLDFAISGRRVIAGDWTGPGGADGKTAVALVIGPNAPMQHATSSPAGDAHNDERARERARRAVEQAAADEAFAAAGGEASILPAEPVAFVLKGENVIYLDPAFVPYKMRPHVRALRMAIDVAKIP